MKEKVEKLKFISMKLAEGNIKNDNKEWIYRYSK